MIEIQHSDPLSPEDYIEAEKSSPIKREYHDGDVYAIAEFYEDVDLGAK